MIFTKLHFQTDFQDQLSTSGEKKHYETCKDDGQREAETQSYIQMTPKSMYQPLSTMLSMPKQNKGCS